MTFKLKLEYHCASSGQITRLSWDFTLYIQHNIFIFSAFSSRLARTGDISIQQFVRNLSHDHPWACFLLEGPLGGEEGTKEWESWSVFLWVWRAFVSNAPAP